MDFRNLLFYEVCSCTIDEAIEVMHCRLCRTGTGDHAESSIMVHPDCSAGTVWLA